MIQKQLAVAGYTLAIVGDAVQSDYHAAIERLRMDVPTPEFDAIRRLDAHFLEVRVVALANQHRGLLAMPQRTPYKLQTRLADHDTRRDGKKKINAACDQ